MSTPDHALELLATLSAEDRSWILGRLSADAKSRLMGARTDSTPRGDSPAALIDRLAAADPDMLAAVLSGEPSWLVSAILGIQEWPWSKRFLQALSPAIRVEVMQLERQSTCLSQPARDLMLRTLVARLGASRAVSAPATRFDAVLARLRKVRRA